MSPARLPIVDPPPAMDPIAPISSAVAGLPLVRYPSAPDIRPLIRFIRAPWLNGEGRVVIVAAVVAVDNGSEIRCMPVGGLPVRIEAGDLRIGINLRRTARIEFTAEIVQERIERLDGRAARRSAS